ncbi:MAG: sigma 54-dependent Fis family transcriptional regulator [Myxococcales bacterium]|nr:sigma 54-dependent Fis family transcriptional regulator [Myxococcales bacterium]
MSSGRKAGPTLEVRSSMAPPISQPPMPIKLVVVMGPDAGKEISLDGSVRVGTATDNDLRLTDPRVSRAHATFSLRDGLPHVTDAGSSNGTFIGEARVAEAQVPVGAVVRLGPSSAVAVQPRWYLREVDPSEHQRFGDMLGRSLAMREVFAVLERAAGADVALLLEGETGTGKEVAARSVHAASPRSSGPYTVFDCGAVPPNLAESELFGHKRGAFSGAVADRAGAFQQASGGTIFLDEIGELPLELQPKLLRVLETGEVRRVGDDALRRVDVRVVAATNRDLHAEARRGAFREDLLYRLDVVRVRLPALRHRPDDVALLVRHFIGDRIDPDDPIAGPNLDRLLSYAWPGNVRELRNVLQRAVALAPPGAGKPRFSELVFNVGPLRAPATFGMNYPGVESPMPYKEARDLLLSSFERAYVQALLERHDGNITHAAAAAGVSRKSLYELMRRAEGEAHATEVTLDR